MRYAAVTIILYAFFRASRAVEIQFRYGWPALSLLLILSSWMCLRLALDGFSELAMVVGATALWWQIPAWAEVLGERDRWGRGYEQDPIGGVEVLHAVASSFGVFVLWAVFYAVHDLLT